MTNPPTVEPSSSFADVTPPAARNPDPQLPGFPHSEVAVLSAALGLGILLDVLTNGDAPGVGMTVYVLLAMAAVALLTGRYGLALASRGRWLAVAGIAALGLVFTYRDSGELLAINVWAIFVVVVLLSVRVAGRRLLQIGILEFVWAIVEVPIFGVIRACQAIGRQSGRILSFTAYDAEEAAAAEAAAAAGTKLRRGRGREIGIGILIALPVLVVFTALLSAADAGFAELVRHLFDWDWSPESAALHIGLIGVGTLGTAMLLISALAFPPLEHRPEKRLAWATDIVVWIVLGSVILLFATYLALQAGYFFGGAAYLADQAGLTAAEYARRGFIELLVVAALVVPLLLLTRQVTDSDGARRALRFTGPLLALATIGLIGSAIARLWIYQDRFGLTMFRINAAVIIIWIAVGLAWLAVRMAMDRPSHLAAFWAIVGVGLILVMDVVNPARLIVTTNLDRADREVTVTDIGYLVSLGADAVPALVDNADQLSRTDRARLEQRLKDHGAYADDDWRNWNLARSSADDAIPGRPGPARLGASLDDGDYSD